MAKQNIGNKKRKQMQALAVVEKLSEESVSEDYLLSIVSDIRQTHYGDIVEERSIINLCGYPLCPNTLSKVVAKKYHISRLNNKVYDITERKKFCSNQCYKSSKYFEEQLLTSPVWLEEETPIITLLPLNNKGSVGVELTFDNLNISELKADEEINDEPYISNEKPQKKNVSFTNHAKEPRKSSEQNVNIKSPLKDVEKEDLLQKNLNNEKTEVPIDVKEKINGIKTVHLPPNKGGDTSVDLTVGHVEQIFKEWVTAKSLDYLSQEERLSPNGSQGENNGAHVKTLEHGYENLCRKLKMLEMQENLEDSELMESEMKTKIKLPEYQKLKEDAQKTTLKVKAFYKGQVDYLLPENSDKVDTELQNEEPSIPIIDSRSQDLLRRRIVLDHLSNVYSQMQTALGLRKSDFSHHLKFLISTFRFTASNIVLKPAEWMLVGIILLQLLSLKERKIKEVLSAQKTEKILTLLMKNMQRDLNYVKNFASELLEKKNILCN